MEDSRGSYRGISAGRSGSASCRLWYSYQVQKTNVIVHRQGRTDVHVSSSIARSKRSIFAQSIIIVTYVGYGIVTSVPPCTHHTIRHQSNSDDQCFLRILHSLQNFAKVEKALDRVSYDSASVLQVAIWVANTSQSRLCPTEGSMHSQAHAFYNQPAGCVFLNDVAAD